MPFNIELINKPKVKLWTFVKTEDANRLQSLVDKGDRDGYIALLTALTKSGHRQFSRTGGVVYEQIDKNEEGEVAIKFQVKNSVITWAFIAPMDRTHQAFRDRVFSTAAKAHASVGNSCETYYRGTNHYHLKTMHTYKGESEFNHNHYRTKDDGPITPVEVYEHIQAFCAQAEGRFFIPTPKERNDIILDFGIYWAEFNLDINYVALSYISNPAGKAYIDNSQKKILFQLQNIAQAGKLTPEQANAQLDKFFASEHGLDMLKMAEARGFPYEKAKREAFKEELKAHYLRIYNEAMALDPELEPHKPTPVKPGTGASPRDTYLSSRDQVLDEIDKAEYEAFAHDLTKHCKSINKQLLHDLKFEDFRRGLLLYHALRDAQQEYLRKPKKGHLFHLDLTMDSQIKQMIQQLPSLQRGSTEDELGPILLNQLVTWIKGSTQALNKWIDWVSVNGARGLGSEIAQVRQVDGGVYLNQAIPQGDRGPNSKVPEIDFNKVNLADLFLPKKPAQKQPLVNDDTFGLNSYMYKPGPVAPAAAGPVAPAAAGPVAPAAAGPVAPAAAGLGVPAAAGPVAPAAAGLGVPAAAGLGVPAAAGPVAPAAAGLGVPAAPVGLKPVDSRAPTNINNSDIERLKMDLSVHMQDLTEKMRAMELVEFKAKISVITKTLEALANRETTELLELITTNKDWNKVALVGQKSLLELYVDRALALIQAPSHASAQAPQK